LAAGGLCGDIKGGDVVDLVVDEDDGVDGEKDLSIAS
jgi:hypothetical protein